ncbi:putative quinol monooxygenase [Niveibacterium terrae]|uniref:putative quinol monooxygenase n=1 Tax=Niveibacterium terrae TaxID=3373598 RepID=UPI003A906BF7
MIVAQVVFSVKPDRVEDFVRSTMDNVMHSRREAGVVSFGFYKVKDSASSFLLFEQYRSAEDQVAHRETAHYKRWKESVADLLACPYTVALLDSLG